jgi:hypothetical protein
MNFTKLKAPLVFSGDSTCSYSNPSAIRDRNNFILFFKENAGNGEVIRISRSADLRFWSRPETVPGLAYDNFQGFVFKNALHLFAANKNSGTLCHFISKSGSPFQEEPCDLSSEGITRFAEIEGKLFIFVLRQNMLSLENDAGTVIFDDVKIDASSFSVASDGRSGCYLIAEKNGIFTSYHLENLNKPVMNGGYTLDLDETHFSFGGNSYPSLVYDEESGFVFLFYQAGGSIAIAASRDGRHFITFARDKITYPDHGIIYDGDYYKPLPFSQYIKKVPLPKGKNVFDVRDFGAVPDTSFISTPAFLAAFDAAKANGGGTVLVAGGYYCTSTLSVPGNTTLFIDYDSAVYASKDISRYTDMLVGCIDSENITITGGGKIIGNGEYFVYLPLRRPLLERLPYTRLPPVFYDPMGYPIDSIRYAYRSRIRYAEDRYGEGLCRIPRPMYTVWIRGCRNVTIENIIIQDALDWTLDIDYSQYVSVRDLVIDDNRHVANTDGIDVMSSRHVTVDHCFVSCADDGLCIKSPRRQGHDDINVSDATVKMGPTEDVHFRNCTVSTVMNAFKIGTETYFDIHDISVENCHFMMTDIYPGSASGISIESADGANISDVRISNITMDKVCCPLFICLNMRNKFGFDDDNDKKLRYYGGSIKNISIEHISADDAEIPSILTGFAFEGKEKKIENIAIRDFKVIYYDGIEKIDILPEIHENIFDYPESNSFGDVPACGLFIRHAHNVELKEISITPRSMNTRPCIVRDCVD